MQPIRLCGSLMDMEKQKYYKGDICFYYNGPEMRFEVEIVEVRTAYGRVDYLIRPIAGEGDKWVSQISLDKK